jgi:hypothetical protein
MTGLDCDAVENVLRVLFEEGLIEGFRPTEPQYPTVVRGIC